MELDLFYDTETSGFPSKKIPMHDKDNAWIMQLGFLLCNEEHTYLEGNLYIQSEGRSVNPFALKVHKITTNKCDRLGVSESEAVAQFYSAVGLASNIICHNEKFDRGMIRHLLASHVVNHTYEDVDTESDIISIVESHMQDNYYSKNVICTMLASTAFCKIPGNYGKPKWPKLEELYKILFNIELEDAHDAVIDAMATRRCYYELKKRGVI